MVDLRSRLIEYVNSKSNVVDLQFDTNAQPSLSFDPYSADQRERKKITHYFLLVASVDEGNVVGEAGNARKLLVSLYSTMKDKLYSADEEAFQQELSTSKRFPAREARLIPNILNSVNSFVANLANGDLMSYSRRFDTPAPFAEKIAINILRMGGTIGSTRKKTWMYLRWMVRGRPDMQLFDHFNSKDLFIPVDRNVARVAVCVGRVPEAHLKSLTWEDTVQVTELARDLFPSDPAKIDYPFFLLGRKLRFSRELSERSLLSAI